MCIESNNLWAQIFKSIIQQDLNGAITAAVKLVIPGLISASCWMINISCQTENSFPKLWQLFLQFLSLCCVKTNMSTLILTDIVHTLYSYSMHGTGEVLVLMSEPKEATVNAKCVVHYEQIVPGDFVCGQIVTSTTVIHPALDLRLCKKAFRCACVNTPFIVFLLYINLLRKFRLSITISPLITKGTAWEICFWPVETVQRVQLFDLACETFFCLHKKSPQKMPVSSSCLCLCLSVPVPPTICLTVLRPSRRRRPFDGARALKTRPFNLSNPEIQWKFVRRKFLHGAEEGRIFIEDIFDGVWSFGRSTKTSFKLSLPKKEKGKGVGRRRGSKGELCWLRSGTLYFSWGGIQGGVREVKFCVSLINIFIQSGFLHSIVKLSFRSLDIKMIHVLVLPLLNLTICSVKCWKTQSQQSV